MSTFNGLVPEFPDIRIDFFRNHAGAAPPLACFLSHVHSDHFAGLETLRSPFVYCSAATRAMLLRLETYPCRINYAKKVLETRQQTFKHLSKVMKPLPLETPTVLELQPNHHIQVTLFDANHCPGAVMFLIEGDGKAILYTGDVRSEPWFVQSICRNPNLIEYTHGIKVLDKLYLDTSFLDNVPFQTKAQGIAELLRKVRQYPEDTIFYVQSWTYGYEDVWIALSKALHSQIHVDDYKYRVYSSLRPRMAADKFSDDAHLATVAAALSGYMCGNTSRPGCLTRDENVRLHSCESANMCEAARGKSVVRIQPVVARVPGGQSIPEAGIGGGGEDLKQNVELGYTSPDDLKTLLEMLVHSLSALPKTNRIELMRRLLSAMSSGRNIPLPITMSGCEHQSSSDEVLKALASSFCETLGKQQQHPVSKNAIQPTLTNVIRFPYSRHSSYPELCDLVNAFKPRDVWPCTENMDQWLEKHISISSLFGNYCSGHSFEYDVKLAEKTFELVNSDDCHTTDTQVSRPESPPVQESSKTLDNLRQKRDFDEVEGHAELDEAGESQRTDCSFTSVLSTRHSRERHAAYERMLRNASGGSWSPIELISTDANHSTRDEEL